MTLMNQPVPTCGVAIFSDGLCNLHDVGKDHPERPARLDAVQGAARKLADAGQPVHALAAVDASRDAILRVHTETYLDALAASAGRWWSIDPDTTAMQDSYAAAVRAAGCAIAAVDAVCSTSPSAATKRAFAIVRPPGHHALADRGMGFCLLNNIAIAARHAQAQHGIKRVAIVDFDVHHGNGTEAIFAADPSVLFVSTHQSPLYPGTGELTYCGEPAGGGTTVNLPLPEGADNELIVACYGALVRDILDAFAPQLLLVSAGYDLHIRDPLGGFAVDDNGVGEIAAHLVATAERHCDGRVVFVLEGGYDLEGLSGGVTQSLRALIGLRNATPRPTTAPLPTSHIQRARAACQQLRALRA